MNYRPIVGSLLSKLQKAGYTLISAEGQTLQGTDRERRQQAKKYICSTVSCYLYVENSECITKWIQLRLTDTGRKLIYDSSLDSGLAAVFEDFENQWTAKQIKL